MELSIVLPAYKEAENLKNLLPVINDEASMLNIDYEILVVDTKEKMDDTFSICKQNEAIYINREFGDSYGDAIRIGIKNANGKYILIMDADGSHEPKSISDLYSKIKYEGFDVVVGSRYCKGGSSDNNFILKMMSFALNMTYRLFFNLKINDCSNSFRIYNADKIKSIILECCNFDIVEEILIKLHKIYPYLKICEIPVHFRDREKGESKRNLLKFVFSYIFTIKKLMKIKTLHNK